MTCEGWIVRTGVVVRSVVFWVAGFFSNIEAGKDFVDVLSSFLTFPLGNIAIQMEKESIEVGSLSSLYPSVTNIDKVCLSKEMLLQLRNSLEAYMDNLKVNIDDILLRVFCM